MNKVLAQKVINRILANSLEFDMTDWFAPDPHGISPCGTVACIAGETVFVASKEALNQPDLSLKDYLGINRIYRIYRIWSAEAAHLLALTPTQEASLFYPGSWPAQFHDEWSELSHEYHNTSDCEAKAKLRVKMAKVAAARLQHMIDTEQ
jgi:hypothetical protein